MSLIAGNAGAAAGSHSSGPEPVPELVPDDRHIVYVAGLPRSGSTVLGYVLSRLPGTLFVGELAYFWRRFASRELCSCGEPLPECVFWSAVVSDAFGSLTPEQACELSAMEQRALSRQRLPGLAPVRWSSRWPWGFDDITEERAQLYGSIYKLASVTRIVDSGKEATFGAVMARLGDDTRFSTVHLVRDPRGVAFSWQKQVRSDSELRDMPRSSAVRTATRWVTCNVSVRVSLKRLSDTYVRVRYEDLIANSDQVVRDIAAAIFGNEALARVAGSHAHGAGPHHLVASNPGVRSTLGGEIQLVLDDEWQASLPRLQQWQVVAVCGSLMSSYGYPLRAVSR
jgi:hypothetical protein